MDIRIHYKRKKWMLCLSMIIIACAVTKLWNSSARNMASHNTSESGNLMDEHERFADSGTSHMDDHLSTSEDPVNLSEDPVNVSEDPLSTPVPAAWDINGRPVQCYITSKQKGRLGNQIFQYAALYAVTRQFKECTPFLGPDFINLTSTFDLSIPVMDVQYGTEKRIWELEKNVDRTLQRLTLDKIPRHKNITIKGFYLSYRYVDRYKDQFRKELKFKDDVLQMSKQFLETNTPAGFRGSDFVRIGIHVRRTDRNTPFMTRLGYIRPPLKYYEHAMAYFTERHKNVQFVIASDDVEWCQAHLKADHIVFSHDSFAVDLAVLSSCDHVITSVGTFGWWAGWLCEGTTVYHALFPPPGTKAAAVHVPANWYPPNDRYNKWLPIV